ncbi:MAG: PhpK family radical SAM P-methyltransferase [Acidobacteriia bacterium]|nr:PhpK family radical SAM P-methyltransferase [Terriglobia bacterium]
MPFDKYEPLIRRYGEDSEVYRDLKFSFVDIGGKPTNYVDLMNLALRAASAGQERPVAPFRSGEIPNLAAVYLCNFLRRHRLGARYINLFQDEKDLFAQWLEQEPVCVAITTTFYILNFPVNEIVQFVRSCNPRIKIVVGGPLVSNHLRNLDGNVLEAALADMQADFYVLDSQGEMTLASLVAALKNGNDVGHVPNLAYFDGKQLVRTPLVPETNSMDESDIKWREFAVESHLGRTIQMRTARSCAFKCAFCNYPKRAGALSLASLDTIERELDSIRLIDDVSQVVFIDDTFNVPLPRFKDLCRLMIRKKFGFNWFSYFRCSNADEEAFDLMAQSGCKGVFLGIESGSPAILKNMNKAATIERYAEGIRSLRQRNILTFASFIVGFPGETGDTVNETTAFIRQQRPDFYRAQMWYCEPGTPILQERAKYDIRGDGFVWEHATMTSLEAMDCIEDMFLAVEESSWLPQWSFDFWFIPYIVGRGMSIAEFKTFVSAANQMLAMDIAPSSSIEKERDQKRCLARITSLMKSLNQKLVCADARSLR